MKRVLILLSLSLFFSASSFAQSWSESELQQMYIEFLLSNSSYSEVRVDSDGDIQFSYNDRTYFIEVNEGDNEFFRVVLFNIWPIESASESRQALKACNAVNREMKVIKAYVTSDNVWIASELFLGEPEQFKATFTRMLKVIDDAVDTFVEKM